MRQPMEDHEVVISRATDTFSLPANFTLVAAMNPCPCGFYGDPVHECTWLAASSAEQHQAQCSTYQ